MQILLYALRAMDTRLPLLAAYGGLADAAALFHRAATRDPNHMPQRGGRRRLGMPRDLDRAARGVRFDRGSQGAVTKALLAAAKGSRRGLAFFGRIGAHRTVPVPRRSDPGV
jgi:hypothetical protein